MKTHRLALSLVIFGFLILGQKAFAAPPFNYVFAVNSTADTHDAAPGDNLCLDSAGGCTLRAAVEEANAADSGDTIIFSLPLPNEINLTLGQITIVEDLSIVGPDARKLTIQRSPAAGTPNFRLFSIVKSVITVCNISGLTLANGNAGSDLTGGAINVEPGEVWLYLREVTLRHNTATRGGAIASAGRVYLDRATLHGNSVPNAAEADGGAIFNGPGGKFDIDNSTLTNNSAHRGGAIMNYANFTLNNVTLSHNAAGGAGGAIYSLTGTNTFYARNALVADNTAAAAAGAPNAFGTFNSDGNNLIGDATGATGFTNGVNGDIAGTAAAPVNPLLGALQNNGGQTDTRALGAGSPAIDRGNNCVLSFCWSNDHAASFISDQRNHYKRGIGAAVDIGAFETGSSPVIYLLAARVGVGYMETNRPLFGALISFTDLNGAAKYCVTKPSGSCRVSDLVVGDPYIVRIGSKGRSDGAYVYYFDVLPNQLPGLVDLTAAQTKTGFIPSWMKPVKSQ